jgi:hypothetical protein
MMVNSELEMLRKEEIVTLFIFVVFLSLLSISSISSSDFSRTVSFHILPNALLSNHPAIRCYIVRSVK